MAAMAAALRVSRPKYETLLCGILCILCDCVWGEYIYNEPCGGTRDGSLWLEPPTFYMLNLSGVDDERLHVASPPAWPAWVGVFLD